ncbi:MAG: GerMN domain-containing protein [Cyanobacteria bacterium J06638_38]
MAQISALWLIAKAMLPTWTSYSNLVELKPVSARPQIYHLSIAKDRIRLIPETIDTVVTSPKLALEEAFKQLLAASIVHTISIPSETRLLGLDINQDEVHLNLSQEFIQGGDSSSIIYRVAQVLYTATSINPKGLVFLSVEGTPLNEEYPLGGEGTDSSASRNISGTSSDKTTIQSRFLS